MTLRALVPMLEAAEEELLEHQCTRHIAPAGTVLCAQGDLDQDVFFILSGKVGIYRALKLAGKTTAIKIAVVDHPLIVGEMNLFARNERNASILVESEIEYLQLTEGAMEELERIHPTLMLTLLKYAGSVVAQRYTSFLDRFETRLLSQVKTRYHAMQVLELMMDKVSICSPEVAYKLFGIKSNFLDDQQH